MTLKMHKLKFIKLSVAQTYVSRLPEIGAFVLLRQDTHGNGRRNYKNYYFMASALPSSYGCTREAVKHERSVRVARSGSRVRLWLLESLATSQVHHNLTHAR